MKKVVIPDKALLDTEGATLPSDAIRAINPNVPISNAMEYIVPHLEQIYITLS